LSFISEHYAPTELVEITHVFVITLFFSSAVWLFPQQKSFTWVSSFFPQILEPGHKQWQTNKAKKKQKEQRAMQQQAHAYMEVVYLASLHDWEIVRILECNF
jgi:hypothetical protein